MKIIFGKLLKMFSIYLKESISNISFLTFISFFYIHNNCGMDNHNLMSVQNLINDISFSNQDYIIPDTPALEDSTLTFLSSFAQEKKTTKNNKRHCLTCDKFFNKNYYYIHLRLHTGEKNFVCNICDKPFANKSNLIRHHRVHTGERPFICKICNKRFPLNQHLTEHIRIHTGEKPFVCEICDIGFAQSGDLKKHKKSKKHADQEMVKQNTFASNTGKTNL